jgi:hypothetical protein
MQEKNNRAGIYSVNRIADGLTEFIFREQESGTTGIDGHIEINKPSYKFSRVLGAKIYCVDADSPRDVYVCSGSRDKLIYWFQHSIPILIMAYDSITGKVFWEHLREDNIIFSESGWSIDVPKKQELDEEAVRSIYEIPSYSPNLSRLAVDRPWMDMIESGNHKIFLTAEENINRPTRKGVIKINITDLDGEKQHIYDWPFFINPDRPFAYRFNELFPWAEISVDQEFYSTHADSETSYGVSLCNIRPWTIEAGEVAHFRLEMRLSELGKSFLCADRFICNADYDENKLVGSFGSMYEKGLKYITTNP